MRFIKVISVAIIMLLLLTLGSCAQAPKDKSAPVTRYTDLPLSGEDVAIGSHDDEYGFHIVNRVEFTHPQDYSSKNVAHSYQTLQTDRQKTIYDKVLDACYCFSDEKVEGDTTYKMRPVILDGTGFSPKEAEAAIIAAFDDHPEIFWMDYLFDIDYEYDNGSHITKLVLRSEYTADQVVKMMQEIDDALAAFYREMPKELSAYEREVYVYKYIIDHCVYDENILDDKEYEESHPSLFNLYGVMVDHVAVCVGYAYSFDYLCSELGIDTVCISGTVVLEEDGAETTDTLHLWNAVELDGEWYMADVTWDDPDDEEEIRDAYVYLNITDQVMALDHTTDKTYAQITDDEYGLLECYINNFLPPTCTATDYCYYLREGIRMSSPEVDVLRDGIVRAAEKRSAALMINVGSDTTAQALCDSLFDGDQPYYQAMDRANTDLTDAPLNTDADAVYYCLDDRGLIVFEMPYR
ncbi:transglutaminase domain-containing protein [Ruminococcus sp.]|uniref:transglutaminase domain-containing protein n=1 Tax=Ruminococcus sp. TaxID=41978 RepID=UPI003869DDDC